MSDIDRTTGTPASRTDLETDGMSRSVESPNPHTRYTFGPVPSRRLGTSLGINTIPAKVCTYACLYCQAGRTTQLRDARRPFYDPEAVLADVKERVDSALKGGHRPHYLTFVPDGEPTLDLNLGTLIRRLKPLGIPVGVITNGSLLWRDDVRQDLLEADWVSVKLDAGEESAWRQINRPHGRLRLSQIIDGLRLFAQRFGGALVTETMLLNGINDSEDCVLKTARILHEVRPARAYLGIPTRPPAAAWARKPDEADFNRAYRLFSEELDHVECLIGYEGNEFACSGDPESDILSITAVHPMREDAVRTLMDRYGSWNVVEKLIADGKLVRTLYDGQAFYLRRFGRSPEAPR